MQYETKTHKIRTDKTQINLVVLNIQTKLSPAQHKFRKKSLLLCLGVHLQLTPINYAPNFFLRPEGVRAPDASRLRLCNDKRFMNFNSKTFTLMIKTLWSYFTGKTI